MRSGKITYLVCFVLSVLVLCLSPDNAYAQTGIEKLFLYFKRKDYHSKPPPCQDKEKKSSVTEKQTLYYPDGKMRAKGKMAKYDISIPHSNRYRSITKKIGTWKYYYPDGNIRRKEKYKKERSRNPLPVKDGRWKYYNPSGNLVFFEKYNNDELVSKTEDVYKDSTLIYTIHYERGNITNTQNNSRKDSEDTLNLILNSDFAEYKLKPREFYTNSTHHLSELIPAWNSTDNITPVYFNTYLGSTHHRHLTGDSAGQKRENYIGLQLHDKNTYLVRYIHTKLKEKMHPGKLYCIQLSISTGKNRHSIVAGLSILLDKELPIHEKKLIRNDHKVKFSLEETDNQQESWKQYCIPYKANGNEMHFGLRAWLHSVENKQGNTSSSMLTDAPVFLYLDKVAVLPVADSLECQCHNGIKRIEEQDKKLSKISGKKIKHEFDWPSPDMLKPGHPVVLKKIYFEFDKSKLLPQSYEELDKLVKYLDYNPKLKIEILGHTDNQGSEKYNYDLSLRRAKEVVQYLISQGIDKNRLGYIGFGEEIHIADNRTPYGRAKNRRVEFRIVEK
jgi:outer membrane protein OmpA-like peptidoglycan-associated protein